MLMKPREIAFGQDAREKILKGVEILAKAVRATLGPRGESVIIEMPYQAPIVTKDGITVARWISVKDPHQNLGVQMMKEAAARTAEAAGDGTTTATVLGHALFAEAFKLIAAGAAPIELKRGIDRGVEEAVKHLEKMSRLVERDKDIEQVATISANGDKEIGKCIAKAVLKVGKDGVVTIEEGKSYGLETEVVDGMELDQGFVSPYFITNANRMEAVIESHKGVKVLLLDRELSSLEEMVNLLDHVSNEGYGLLVVAHDINSEALSALVLNKVKNTLNAVGVKAPGFGANRSEELDDIAILTGATVLGGHAGEDLSRATSVEVLGNARRVIARRTSTTIIGMDDKDVKKRVKDRVKALRDQIEYIDEQFEKENTRVRAAQLEGGVAVIRVGAASDVEMREKKDRVDDALSATKAAAESGIVPGGGVALLRCVEVIKKINLKGDQALGLQLLAKVLEEPIRRIVANTADADNQPDVVLHLIKNEDDDAFGFDAATGKYGNLFDMGIIDPLKVVRSALQHASSVATTMMTASVAVVEDPNVDDGNAMPPMMPPGMGGGF